MKQFNKPVIGITSSTVNHNAIKSLNLHERFVQSVIDAGAVPFIIPSGTGDMPEIWVSMCDGLILSSGDDVDPFSYGENPVPAIQKVDSDRDNTEIALVQSALKQNKPILAVCRGITMLNAALGGTVIQDIKTNVSHSIKHFQQAERPKPTHRIQVESESFLHGVLNHTNIRVNSHHHQAINRLAPGLKVTATAPDGVIEAVESDNISMPFLMGIQWHPEAMAKEDPMMQELFKSFVVKCSENSSGDDYSG